MILTLDLIEKLLPKKYQTKRALNIIRGFIIGYTFLNLLYFIIGNILYPEKFAITNRAVGPYAISYWFMTFGALLLPMTLFYKRLGLNAFYLIFVSFLMKSGMYFERFVIIVTSIHRDYLPSKNSNYSESNTFYFLFYYFSIILLQGFILAILILLLINFFDKYKSFYVTSRLRSK